MSSSIPTTSKVLKGDGGTSITLENRQTPSPTGTQVLLKIEASGVCATDLHLVRKALPHLKPKVDIQGHEGIGRIMKVGPDVDGSKWKVGDLVAHRWLWSVCQQCELCQGGNEQLCDERKLSGMHVDGCWAEYSLSDTKYMLPVSEQLNVLEAAPILCAGTTVYRAVRTANLSPGQWIAIVGSGGGLGHLAIQYAKARSLKVLGIDGSHEKGSLSTRLGADAFIDFTQTKDLTADVLRITNGGAHGVLVTSSSPKAYEQAVTYVRKLGVLICIGIAPTKMQFPVGPDYFVAKGVTLTGTSTGTRQDTIEALELVRSGKVKPVVFEIKLEDVSGCLEKLENGDGMGRFVIKM